MACHCGDPKSDCEQRKEQIFQQSGRKSYLEIDGTQPAYLPLPSDFTIKAAKPKDSVDFSIGEPWATGRPIWSSTADLIGVRPIVDRYTITKYGLKDWRKGNLAVMEIAGDASSLKDDVKCIINSVAKNTDKNQNDNTIRLQQRLQQIKNYQNQIEALVMDIREEIVLLTETKVRLKFALPALKMPESIAGECIDKRTCRIDPDLVKDEVDVELVKEMGMIYEMRELIMNLLNQVENQIVSNRACKDELENNWSDKKETNDIEEINVCLRNTSPAISYKHGSTRMQHLQTTPETWEHYCQTIIKIGNQQLKKSRDLRGNLDSEVITGPMRDLKNQANKVQNLLKNRIAETDQCRQAFERQLQKVLVEIAETESLYDGLNKLLRQLDYSLKVAETRLDSRMYRPRSENCRDEVQYGLIAEVKELNDNQSALKRQVEEVDTTLAKLYQARANLEFAIMAKRKSLYIDRQRCLAYREQYPDITTLTGGSS